MSPAAASPRISRQRGALSPLAAIGLATAVASALLAVDLGNLFYARRHLQTVADTAALSAVNAIPEAQAVATGTAGANDFPLPGKQGNTLQAVAGSYDYEARAFTAGGNAAEQNAVQVTVTTQQPYFFILGSRQVSATATAARTDIAGISVGSGLLDIDSSKSALLNGLLGGLLETTLKLEAAAYNGLATTSIRLLDLVKAQGSVGTVNELLDLDLSVRELLDLTAIALSQTDVANVNLKDAQGAISDLMSVKGDLHLKLSDLIDASLAPGHAAAETQINVLQLITLAAQVANGKNFLNIPAAGLDLGGLAKIDLALSIIEPPKIAIGPPGRDSDGNWRTRAHTAQVRLKLDVKLLELLNGSLVHLPIYLEVAAAEAGLNSISCAAPRESSTVAINANTSLVRAYIGEVNKDAMTNVTKAATVDKATIVSLTGLLGITGVLDVTTKVALDLPGGSQELQFHGPFDDDNTQRVSGLSTGGLFEKLGSDLDLDVELLGINLGLGSALKPLMKLLTPIFGLLDALLAPVLQLLGIQLGFGDVTAFHLKCGAPQLVR